MVADNLSIGTGVLHPLRFVGDDFDVATGTPLFQSRLGKILGVQAATPDGKMSGELPWRRNFGSQAQILQHLNVDDFYEDLAHVYVVDAIYTWEPLAIASIAEVVAERRDSGQKSTVKIRFSRFADQVGDTDVDAVSEYDL
jgi:phage baseplate assembly protein W